MACQALHMYEHSAAAAPLSLTLRVTALQKCWKERRPTDSPTGYRGVWSWALRRPNSLRMFATRRLCGPQSMAKISTALWKESVASWMESRTTCSGWVWAAMRSAMADSYSMSPCSRVAPGNSLAARCWSWSAQRSAVLRSWVTAASFIWLSRADLSRWWSGCSTSPTSPNTASARSVAAVWYPRRHSACDLPSSAFAFCTASAAALLSNAIPQRSHRHAGTWWSSWSKLQADPGPRSRCPPAQQLQPLLASPQPEAEPVAKAEAEAEEGGWGRR
mmetsp:Transcript_23113/g.39704  ORF Transcript_23113/g.39704 Transcript_23113/m.39704 type:complete len:275 (-) Transcript_23113:1220-2044(-)